MKKTARHTLVIDGSYFLFKTLYVLPHMTKSKEILSSKKDMITFKTFEHQEDAIEDIKFILEKYEGSYYSLSGGEL